MEIKQKLYEILQNQKNLLKQYEEITKDLDLNNILEENSVLKAEIKNFKMSLDDVSRINKGLKQENNGLKISMKEQMLDEKLNILRVSRQKIDTYFEQLKHGYENSLTEFERTSREKIEKLSWIISKELRDDATEFNTKIDEISNEVSEKIKKNNENFSNQKNEVNKDVAEKVHKIGSEDINEEVLQKRIRQNNMEFKIGLSWLNKIGMFLILVGLSTGLKYTYSNSFSPTQKGIFIFLIGIIFIVSGEYFVKKSKEIFGLGMTGGGIGILYLAIFHSHFNLKILEIEAAIIVSILVTMVSFVLSIRYNSKTISVFSLIGGFLPFFTYAFTSPGINGDQIYISMGYLLILNALTLLISINKKWEIVKYISYLLNVPTLVFLVFQSQNDFISITYSIVTFAMYLVVSLVYPFRHKLSLKMVDVFLLAINTLVSCMIIFTLFERAKLSDFKGVLAITFCFVYFGLGQFANKYINKEKDAQVLFYLTAYTFAVLAIPFQLGIKWVAMGWLVEAVLMIIYGYKSKIKYLEIGGWVVFALCFTGVVTIDFVRYELLGDKNTVPAFHFRYLCVMLGMISTLYTYLIEMSKNQMLKYSERGKFITGFKYFVIINFWVFAVYMSNSLFNRILVPNEIFPNYYNSFINLMLFNMATLVVAFAIIKLPLILDRVVKIISNILFIMANFLLVYANFLMPVFSYDNDVFRYFAIVTLMFFNIFTFFNIKYLAMDFMKNQKLGLGSFNVFMCIYLLANITGLMTVQFNLGDQNLLYSLLYIVFAFVSIVYGFLRKCASTRRFGLGLAVFAMAKLFIYDLSFLETGGKIVSYLSFGVVLLAISFLYQKFSKLLTEDTAVKVSSEHS